MISRLISGFIYTVVGLALVVTAGVLLIGGLEFAFDLDGATGYIVRGSMVMTVVSGVVWTQQH